MLGLELGLGLPELAPPPVPGDFFGVLLGLVLLDPVLELPLAPDGLEEDVAPPDADLPPSRSHPAIMPLPSANASTAANAVNFILTSMGLCAQ